eukprot:1704422-Rhodomonas_salina.1
MLLPGIPIRPLLGHGRTVRSRPVLRALLDPQQFTQLQLLDLQLTCEMWTSQALRPRCGGRVPSPAQLPPQR